MPLNFRQPGGSVEVKALTSSYTITDQDFGKLFTNRGAGGGVVVTLPAPATCEGEYVEFFTIAAQDFTVKTAAAGQLVAFNDATASSIAITAAGSEIGNGIRMISDGTSWLALPMPGYTGATLSANWTIA